VPGPRGAGGDRAGGAGGRLLETLAFEARPGRWVDIIGYACSAAGADEATSLASSDEHADVGFVDVAALAPGELPVVYGRLIARAARGEPDVSQPRR